MKDLFVGNVNFQTTETELRSIFEPYGQINYVRVITDRETGRSRGFAFVEMANDDEAATAVAALNGAELGGRSLHVSEAKPRAERLAPRGSSASSGRGSHDYYSNRSRLTEKVS